MKTKRPNIKIRGNFVYFRGSGYFYVINQQHKKRPNTIPIFGLGKWLLGESRALKVGILCRACSAMHFKSSLPR
ncbi:hypothetical protein CT690_08540 [Serratia plymuthica]|uniref:Uncharacterized protein n=1 Tax=Serratia plymuthica TaxID=82996 RepID=A0A318PAN8_SERPL|nr:hypothetical protein CT690_08540 [Serratia plymuthica]